MLTSYTLDLNSRIAYYLQLKEILQQIIEKGGYKPGDKLPSEAELCDQFHVSRTVVRQTLMELEHEGLVYKRKGKGAFVAEPKVNVALTQLRTGFSKDMAKHGQKITTHVLYQQIEPVNGSIAKTMRLPEGTRVLRIERVRSFNDEPMVYVNTYLPQPFCEDLIDADMTLSLYDNLRSICNIEFGSGERMIEAVAANEIASRHLGVPVGVPMIKVITFSYLENGSLGEYSVAIHRGDRSRIETKVIHYKMIGNTLKFAQEDAERLFIATD